MPPFSPATGPDADNLPLARADERKLLGALLLHARPALAAVGGIQDKHFTRPEHWRMFRAITAALRGDLPQDLGSADLVTELKAEAPELAAVPEHANAVRDAWIRRELVHISYSMATNATAPKASTLRRCGGKCGATWTIATPFRPR
jgi:replicative DNA helicase